MARKTLRLAPERLHDGMIVRRQLLHFTHQPLESVRAVVGPNTLTKLRGIPGAPPVSMARHARTNPRRRATRPDVKDRCLPGACVSAGVSIPSTRLADRPARDPLSHSGYPGGICETDERAERVAHEHVGQRKLGGLEEPVQVFDDLVERPWSRRTVAPGKAGPIACAQTWVNCATFGWTRVQLSDEAAMPDSRRISRTSRTQADGMKAVVADVDELSGRRKPASAAPGTNGLIEDTQDRQTEEHESGDAHGFIVTERRRTVQRSDPDQYITYFLRISRTTPG